MDTSHFDMEGEEWHNTELYNHLHHLDNSDTDSVGHYGSRYVDTASPDLRPGSADIDTNNRFSDNIPGNAHPSGSYSASDPGDLNYQLEYFRTRLDDERRRNAELEANLSEAKVRIEDLEREKEDKDREVEAEVASRVADIVAELQEAHRSRDAAMMTRLRLANDERDSALDRAKKVNDSAYRRSTPPVRDTYSRVSADGKVSPETENIEELIRCLKDEDDSEFDDISAVNHRVVAQTQEPNFGGPHTRLDVTTMNSPPVKDPDQLRSLRQQLTAVTAEKNAGLDRIQRLEDEIQTLRVYYSLHKSLSNRGIDQNFRASHKDKDSNLLQGQLQEALHENRVLSEKLKKAELQKNEVLVNNEKLERLVAVLRRKLNVLGADVVVTNNKPQHVNRI